MELTAESALISVESLVALGFAILKSKLVNLADQRPLNCVVHCLVSEKTNTHLLTVQHGWVDESGLEGNKDLATLLVKSFYPKTLVRVRKKCLYLLCIWKINIPHTKPRALELASAWLCGRSDLLVFKALLARQFNSLD